MSANKSISDEHILSKVIDYLRFPLIIGVVFIHTSPHLFSNHEIINQDNYPLAFYIDNLFTGVLAQVSVPMFFFISGFLFFYKVENFSHSLYLTKLKKRFKSLLIPYLFWNLLTLLVFYYLIPSISSSSNIEQHPNIIQSLIGVYTEGNNTAYPLVIPFWFIRDLIVCIILSPILFLIVAKTHHLGIILLGIGWFLGFSIPYVGFYGFSMAALFFFGLGAWFSCNKINFITVSKDLKWLAFLYPVIVIADILTIGQPYNIFIHKIGRLIGIAFWFVVIAYLIEKRNLKPIPLLSSASFFVFAIHEPWILYPISKLALSVIKPESQISYVILYFMITLSTVIIAVLIYQILKRLIPSFTALITGGR